MLKAKIFDRQGRSFDELTLELNAFFEAVGDDIPASGIDVQEDHVLAIYEDRSDEVVAGRKEQLETLYEAKRKSVANWLTQETTRRHWEAMVLKKSGGEGKQTAFTAKLREAEIDVEMAVSNLRIINELILEIENGDESGITIG